MRTNQWPMSRKCNAMADGNPIKSTTLTSAAVAPLALGNHPTRNGALSRGDVHAGRSPLL